MSVWLDDISRDRLRTGNLQTLIDELHVVGVTSNPTIFAKSLSSGSAYDEQIADLKTRGVTVDEAARMITTYDIRWACDVFRPVYERTGGLDGRVSLEVDPRLANETENVRYFKIECTGAAAKLRELIRLGGERIEGPWDGEEAITLLPDFDAGAT